MSSEEMLALQQEFQHHQEKVLEYYVPKFGHPAQSLGPFTFQVKNVNFYKVELIMQKLWLCFDIFKGEFNFNLAKNSVLSLQL